MPDRAEIIAAVAEALADSLAIDPSTIRLDSRLVEELSLDSLDLVEVIFLLERRFNIQLKGEELERITSADLSPDRLTADGHLKPDDVARLVSWMPALATSEERHQLQPRQVLRWITVESLVILVERRCA